MIRAFLILLVNLSFLNENFCQDVNFSQFNTIAPYYNPAFTSAFTGNFKVSTIHRNQWIGLLDRPISSFGILGDIKFDIGLKNQKQDYVGAAVYFLTDRSKSFDWNNNEIAVLVAYHKLLEKTSHRYISFGIGLGITQRSINYDNIYFEDQFDGVSKYNGTTIELLPPNIFSKPELKIGVQYNSALNSRIHIQTGIGLHYIFKTNLSFYNNFDNKDYIGDKSIKANQKITGIVNLIYKVDKNNELYPRLLIASQGPHMIINTGLALRRSFYSLNQTAFHMGVSTRIVKNLNSLTPADLGFQIGFEIKNFIVGLHYDIGIKDAVKYASPSHSFELSLSLIGNYDNEGFICPSF